jgi:hypothetical protein
MNVELLGQINQRLLAIKRCHSYLRLEGRAVVPARSLGHRDLLALGHHADVARTIHSAPVFRFSVTPHSGRP